MKRNGDSAGPQCYCLLCQTHSVACTRTGEVISMERVVSLGTTGRVSRTLTGGWGAKRRRTGGSGFSDV